MTRERKLTATAAAVALAAASLTACGGSDDKTTESTATPTSAASGGTVVDVTMGKPGEFSMVPAPTEIPAGPATFKVRNDGTVVHEMVLIKTDKGAANLATGGEVDETGAVDEVADLPAGQEKDLSVTLEPGSYVLLCALPGHYEQGMYTDFTVK